MHGLFGTQTTEYSKYAHKLRIERFHLVCRPKRSYKSKCISNLDIHLYYTSREALRQSCLTPKYRCKKSSSTALRCSTHIHSRWDPSVLLICWTGRHLKQHNKGFQRVGNPGNKIYIRRSLFCL